MTRSTFYHDGYRDGLRGSEGSPPGIPVYENEYWAGYADACRDLEPDRPQYEGSNDTHADAFHIGVEA